MLSTCVDEFSFWSYAFKSFFQLAPLTARSFDQSSSACHFMAGVSGDIDATLTRALSRHGSKMQPDFFSGVSAGRRAWVQHREFRLLAVRYTVVAFVTHS